MDFLTATILSGLIYDGFKSGATIGCGLIKSKLQGWIVDDEQIEKIIEKLQEAGVNEDLAPHVIERKIKEHQPLIELLQEIRPLPTTTTIQQSSNIGHNINVNGNGNVSIGNIIIDDNGK